MTEKEEEIASTMPADLDSLPRLKGFRLRGLEMTRLETFIDAAFAFAVTMLVISNGQVPDDIPALLAAFKNVPAFVASIAVLSIFWRGHWLWSRRFGLEDGVSILISWTMLVTILIYVYPLKLLFGAMFYFLSDHVVGQVITAQTEGQVRALFALYALGFAAIAVEILLLNLRAWRLREPLRLNDHEKSLTRGEIIGLERSGGGGACLAGPGAEFADETYRLERLGVLVVIDPDAVAKAVACETIRLRQDGDEDAGSRIENGELRMGSARALACCFRRPR